jgi:hypothetical protein
MKYSEQLTKLMDDYVNGMELKMYKRDILRLPEEEQEIFEKFKEKHDEAAREEFRKLIRKRVE